QRAKTQAGNRGATRSRSAWRETAGQTRSGEGASAAPEDPAGTANAEDEGAGSLRPRSERIRPGAADGGRNRSRQNESWPPGKGHQVPRPLRRKGKSPDPGGDLRFEPQRRSAGTNPEELHDRR